MDQDQNRTKENKEIIIYFFISLAILSGSIAFLFWSRPAVTAQETPPPPPVKDKSVFKNLHLGARAYVVYNPRNGRVIFGQNETEPLPLASLTKLMTVLTASKLLAPTSTVTIPAAAASLENSAGLEADEKWELSNLIGFTLVASSNGGAAAIASAAAAVSHLDFISLMNQEALRLNLSSMHYENPTGLDLNTTETGGTGSALDIARLLGYIFQHKSSLLKDTHYPVLKVKSESNKLHEVTNTDQAITHLPGLLASKTGYTDLAGGNLAVVTDVGLGQPIVYVVLGSTPQGRFSDMENLVKASLNYFSHYPLD